jgi:4'-phosphopantetheinyl transferase
MSDTGEVSAVELWTVDVDALSDAADGELTGWLSADEQARAAAFARPRDRRRSRRRRAAVRWVLSSYLDVDPAAVSFEVGDHGRPEVAGKALSFGVAHSGGASVVAVSRRRVGVGVDIELDRPLDSLEQMMTVACTDREMASIRSLPPTARSRRFLSVWTAKEAVLKAVGLGLSVDPRQVEVELTPSGGVCVTWVASPLADWFVAMPVNPRRGDLVSALAVAGRGPVRVDWMPSLRLP